MTPDHGTRQMLCVVAALALTAFAMANPALAAPPTAMPSPGYDARLQEQHAAAQKASKPVVAPHRRTHRHSRHAD